MSLAEELRHLIKIRESFSAQLAKLKPNQKGENYFTEVISSTNRRINFILYTASLKDVELRQDNIRRLAENKSAWFNELCRNMIGAISVMEAKDRSNTLSQLLYVFKIF